MNCDAARRLLLDEHSGRSSDDVRRHLLGCAPCRLLAQRLTQVERQIPRLPVPPSSARDAFMRRFRASTGPVVRHVALPWPTPPKERGLQKLSVAVAIAAVLAVFTLAWWSWPHSPSVPAHTEPTLIAQIRQERDRIAALPTPRERVERLDALATDLQDKARTLSRVGDAESLVQLAAVYDDLVSVDLPANAVAVPPEDRAAVLTGVESRLVRAESEFSRLWNEKPDATTARPLQHLAVAARDGSRRIQALLKAA
jgi:hypothetical protein